MVRCAIYTRKSSEEGLEQSFNSLDAQREACQAYIQSQRHEGWKVLPARYDDGGFSGGNMERPALKKLLEDIAAEQIDTVVVYKVDRLTRSLADFAKIVEQFDRQGVSFVSVTQQFNTTTSMGRLTLNVLLSFAQFEREVTGERIRDKVAASKRKGMWMGGVVPLGYDIVNRRMEINPKEADTIRQIYRCYLDLGCVSKLRQHLDQIGIRSKERVSRAGRRSGGSAISRGALYEILRSPLYIGEVHYQGSVYAGQHEAILDRKTWNQVQTRLEENLQAPRRGTGLARKSLLTGLLYDAAGHRFVPTHDFLASRFVANNEQIWNRDSFERVTFSASSFDAIMMCLEQIERGAADDFIRNVYDWNLYGVGYSLGESRRDNISSEMTTVILAMFAERRWDPVLPSRQSAIDTLQQLRQKGAASFLSAPSLEEVFQLVRDHPSGPDTRWFDVWKALFTVLPGSVVEDEWVRRLGNPDSVEGWTIANVLKRVYLSDRQQQILRDFLSHDDSVVRWRAAHSIGSFPSEDNALALIELIDFHDKNVRYGVVRSLLEMASRVEGHLRNTIFDRLKSKKDAIVEFPSVREEVRKCVLIANVANPFEWRERCLNLMMELLPFESDFARERWGRAIQQMLDLFTHIEGVVNA